MTSSSVVKRDFYSAMYILYSGNAGWCGTMLRLDNVQYRDVVVEIERATLKKPFLGGYRHKQTGVEYHHAGAQTMPRSRPQSAVQRFCRDTQTTQQRHARQQTANETSTQMTQIGTYVSAQQDRLVQSRPYTSADERYRTIINKAIFVCQLFKLQLICGTVVCSFVLIDYCQKWLNMLQN